MSVSAARTRVMFAQEHVEKERYDEVDPLLDAAMGFLADVPEDDAKELIEEIAAIRLTLQNVIMPQDQRSISAAQRELVRAREDLAAGNVMAASIEIYLDRAEKYLESVPDKHKADLPAEIAALRAQLGGGTATGAPELTEEQERSMATVKRNLANARRDLEAGDYSTVEDRLDFAEKYLTGMPDSHREPMLAEITGLRARLSGDAGGPSEEEQRSLNAATREVARAKEDLAAGNILPSGIEALIERAERYLLNVGDAHKAELVAEVAALRAGLVTGMATPAAGSPATPASEPSELELRNVSRAKNSIVGIRSNIERGWTEGVEEAIQEAELLLAGNRDDRAPDLLADVRNLRGELAAAILAEKTRRIDEQLSRHFGDAENVKTYRPQDSANAIAFIDRLLADPETVRVLPPDVIERHKVRLADAVANRTTVLTRDSVERALPQLRELEERLESDPFAGLDQFEANRATSELDSLKWRVLKEIKRVDENDPDIAAIYERLNVVDQKIDQASAAWGKAVLDAQVSNTWSMIEQEISGWQDEEWAPRTLLEIPDLSRTRTAIMRIGYLLADPETRRIREENAGDPTIEAPYRTAEEVREAAAAKLAAAYDNVLDEAEKVETPMRRDKLVLPMHLESAARTSFAGTAHEERLVARINELDLQWKAEVAAIMRARQELQDKLTAEADAAWPAILAATGTTLALDPHNPDMVGKTVLIQGVHNRAGWDFSDYDFAVRLNDMPIGGSYEPHVLSALEHAWYELKIDVSDRIPWDMVCVVEGAGKIGLRTNIVLRDKNTNLEIGKIEEWRPIDCLRVRIIALHAGPVAVGPES